MQELERKIGWIRECVETRLYACKNVCINDTQNHFFIREGEELFLFTLYTHRIIMPTKPGKDCFFAKMSDRILCL